MLSIHERVSKQDERKREIKEEIIHRADAEGALVQGSKILTFRQVLLSLCRNCLLIDK